MRFKLSILLLLACLIDFYETAPRNDPCTNVWRFPPNCKGDCTYQLIWRYKPANDSIEFIVSSKYSRRWTGVGFSLTRSLTDSDAIFGWIEGEARYVMMDAFLPTYARPISDKQQSIYNITAADMHGVISFKFLRRRNTGDEQDILFSDDKCPYVIYPIHGGSVDINGRMVITSESAPMISEQPVCFKACNSTSQIQNQKPQLHFPSPVRSTTQHPLVSQTSTTQSPQSTTSTSTTSTSTSTTSTTTTPAPPPSSSSTTTTTTTTTTTSTTTPAPPPTTTTQTSTSTPTPTSTSTSTTTITSTSTTTMKPSISTTEESIQSSITKEQPQWCVGRWSYPNDCRFQTVNAANAVSYLQQPIDSTLNIKPLPLELSDCTYYAQWQYLEASDSVEFIIQTKTRNRWTGIGFSNSTKMPNSDAIIGLIEELSGRHFIMDTWLRDHVMPEIDQHQNTEQTWGKRENGTTTVRFRRKRLTGDPLDFQFTDDSCAYFFFPTQGGTFNAISKRMHKHEVVPSVSKNRICVKRCAIARAVTPYLVSDITSESTSLSSSSSTSQPELVDPPSSSSNTPNLFLSSSAAPAPPVITTSATPGKNSDLMAGNNLTPSNDMNADIDSSSTSPTSASSGHNTNPFHSLAFLSEPSLRWLAGIGCVATLLAMIVFQACFTVYKNKQAYKQNLYRQSAFKQNAYLHGAYLTDAHQPSTTSDETQSASFEHNSVTKQSTGAAQQSLARTTRAAIPTPQQQSQLQRPNRSHQQPTGPFIAQSRPPYDDEFATPSATESSEQEEDEEEDEDLDGVEEEFDEELMMENSLEFGHHRRIPFHHQHQSHSSHHNHPQHSHLHPHLHPHPHPHPHQHSHSHQHPHSHHHPHQHTNRSSPRHPVSLQDSYPQHPRAHAHFRQPNHHTGSNLHRAHLPNRSQPHPQARPDSYFLPSQRRY